MIVLVGLGNPGPKYAGHRHNVGFMAVDAIAEKHGFGPARSKFQGDLREGVLDGSLGRDKAIILKPQTYMNESGNAVRKLADFYKLSAEDFVVFYDELDLVPGKLKVKTGGGAAGHNGIKSIDSHLGNEFRRVRIGIGHPGDRAKVTNHVLGDFAKSDQDWLQPLLDAIASSAALLVADDQRFASDVARQTAPTRLVGPTETKSPSHAGCANKSAAEKTVDSASEPQPNKQRNPFAEAFENIFGTPDNKDK